MNPLQVYQDNVGHTHEAAVQAVYQAGMDDALNASPTLVVPAYPDVSGDLAVANTELAALTAQIAALHDQVAALEAEIVTLTPPTKV
jgi:hypothetical protein